MTRISTVLSLPTLEDRQVVHQLIQDYTHNKLTRNQLMIDIAKVMVKYGVTRLQVFDYSVTILKWYGNLPIISIDSAQMSEKECPVCHDSVENARYLRTEETHRDLGYDTISVTCINCGCVYWTKGQIRGVKL